MKATNEKQAPISQELIAKIKEYLREEIVGFITEEGEDSFVFNLSGGKKIRVNAEEIQQNERLEKLFCKKAKKIQKAFKKD